MRVFSSFPHVQLLSRRNALHERAQSRRAALEDSFHLQQFFRDSDELKSWINEKMKTATDEAYKVCHQRVVQRGFLPYYFPTSVLLLS